MKRQILQWLHHWDFAIPYHSIPVRLGPFVFRSLTLVHNRCSDKRHFEVLKKLFSSITSHLNSHSAPALEAPGKYSIREDTMPHFAVHAAAFGFGPIDHGFDLIHAPTDGASLLSNFEGSRSYACPCFALSNLVSECRSCLPESYDGYSCLAVPVKSSNSSRR